MDFSAGAIAKKRWRSGSARSSAESPLPWVAVPPRWAWATLVGAAERARAAGRPVPRGTRPVGRAARTAGRVERAPIHARLPAAVAEDPSLLERSASSSPARDRGLVPGSRERRERGPGMAPGAARAGSSSATRSRPSGCAALVDRIIETRFDAAARRLLAGSPRGAGLRPAGARAAGEAAIAVAVARALDERGDGSAGSPSSGPRGAEPRGRRRGGHGPAVGRGGEPNAAPADRTGSRRLGGRPHGCRRPPGRARHRARRPHRVHGRALSRRGGGRRRGARRRNRAPGPRSPRPRTHRHARPRGRPRREVARSAWRRASASWRTSRPAASGSRRRRPRAAGDRGHPLRSRGRRAARPA